MKRDLKFLPQLPLPFFSDLDSREREDLRARVRRINLARWTLTALIMGAIAFAWQSGLVEQNLPVDISTGGIYIPSADTFTANPLTIFSTADDVRKTAEDLMLSVAEEAVYGRIKIQFIIGLLGIGLNLWYLWATKRIENLYFFVHLQILLDILIVSAAVYNSGGVVSPFAPLLVFPILEAGILLSMRWAILTTLLSVLSLSSFTALPHNDLFGPVTVLAQSPDYITLSLIANSTLFIAVAVTSGILLRLLKKQNLALKAGASEMTARLRELTIIHETSRAALEAHSRDELMERIMETLVRVMGLHRTLLYIREGDFLVMEKVSFHPDLDAPERNLPSRKIDLRNDPSLTAECARSMKPFNIVSPAEDPRIDREKARKIGLNPFMLCPIVHRGRCLGVLGVDRHLSESPISEREAATLNIVAGQIGASIFDTGANHS